VLRAMRAAKARCYSGAARCAVRAVNRRGERRSKKKKKNRVPVAAEEGRGVRAGGVKVRAASDVVAGIVRAK